MKVIWLLWTLSLGRSVLSKSLSGAESDDYVDVQADLTPDKEIEPTESNEKSKRLVVFDKTDDGKLSSVDEVPNVDDKRGLIDEDNTDTSNHNPNFPRLCSQGIPCQTVDSQVTPPVSSASKQRSVRSLNEGDEYWQGPDCEHEAKVKAFGGMYTLCLFLKDFGDDSIITASKKAYSQINVTIFGSGKKTVDIPLESFHLKYAAGFVKGEPFTSVSGFIMDNHFYGTVIMEDTVHYLEPHRRKSRDMHILGDGRKTLLHRHNHLTPDFNYTQPPESDESTPLYHKVCHLTLVADHLFYKDIGESSINKTLLQILWHVKEANNLIRSKDFLILEEGGGLHRHCLSFTVSEISVFIEKESDVNLLKGEYKVPEDFLKQFSRYNFDGFCLGVLFTNRIFNELVLGLSWRGNPLIKGVGGICQRRVRMKQDSTAYSFNALFISLKSSQEHRIPLRMGVLNLVHELLHSFGARHDPEPQSDPHCVPKDKWINGRFLMSKYSNDGHKLNHEILSSCTEKAVIESLKSPIRTQCLSPQEKPICGDGIVERGEACDCGTAFQCVAAKSCCIPHEGFRNENACTLHKIDTKNCSLSNAAK